MTNHLVIACVKWGELYPPCYVNILYDMALRHLPSGYPFTFTCFTDNPADLHPAIVSQPLPNDLMGCWNKLYLFKEGIFTAGQRVMYLDLDTLIIGSLQLIIAFQGTLALLRDFYRPQGFGSGIMLWQGGTCHHIWSSYEAAGKPVLLPYGDQEWIEKTCPDADILQEVFPNMFISYKVHCHPLPPAGACIVCFHGNPKQDNCDAQWVADVWKIGGAKTACLDMPLHNVEEQRLFYVRQAMTRSQPWLQSVPAHERSIVLVAGGPSLIHSVEAIKDHRRMGHTILAINNASSWLTAQCIGFDAHVMVDAKQEHEGFVPDDKNIMHYYASTCHPAILEGAGEKLVIWHPYTPKIVTLLKDIEELPTLVRGGTAGLAAMHVAYALGYRTLHLYGFDSCYSDGRHHAYVQPENDKDRIFNVSIQNRQFKSAMWMVKQAKEYRQLVDALRVSGCVITVHGDGLLSCMDDTNTSTVEARDDTLKQQLSEVIRLYKLGQTDEAHAVHKALLKAAAIRIQP